MNVTNAKESYGRGEIINHTVLVLYLYISKQQGKKKVATENEVAREGDNFCSSAGSSSSFP